LAGITQPQVSRAEHSQGAPWTRDQAAAYAAALGATEVQTARLVELAAARSDSHITSRNVLVRSAAAIQARIRDLEAAAVELRSWVPDAVPGVLQTEAWTRAILDGDGEGDPGPEWWEARRARVALLDDPGRVWLEVVSEAALRWVVGTRQIAADQVQHLIDLSTRPNVRLGVIDLGTPKSFPMPRGFHLYDRRTVEAATDIGTAFVDEPADVEHYWRLFDRVWGVAVFDDEARGLLARIARSVRHGRASAR
jgi:hypothetical protein